MRAFASSKFLRWMKGGEFEWRLLNVFGMPCFLISALADRRDLVSKGRPEVFVLSFVVRHSQVGQARLCFH